MGRPKKYTDEKIEEIRQTLLDYIDKTNIPILVEFAYKNNIPLRCFFVCQGVL